MWIAMALALGAEPVRTIGKLEIPMTPSEGADVYIGVFDSAGAGAKEWQSDTKDFVCESVKDYVEVSLRREVWPSVLPNKVTCTEVGGTKKVKAKVVVKVMRHVPMFVSDGVLVMPREKGRSANFSGAPPFPDMVVQNGRTDSLNLRCDVVAGPKLEVSVEATAPDGEGFCTLKDKYGAVKRVPIHIVTPK